MRGKVTVLPAEDGKPLGEVLRRRGYSRRLICRLKQIPLGMSRRGELIRTVDTVSAGDEIVIADTGSSDISASPELCAPVLYEDSEVIVFDKPADMPVHPSIKHQDDTLANLFAARCPGTTFRPVNRLDSRTSGCVITARSQFAASALQGRFGKRYLAVCCGDPGESGEINAPIARERDSIILRCVREDGKQAVTRFRAVARSPLYTLCEVFPLTGRTHQIRVHFAHIGCPLAGDSMYGGDMSDIGRQALHCAEVSFLSPDSGESLSVRAPLPADMRSLLELAGIGCGELTDFA
ncbi:MAG: RluA family pseudouridine synthase [Ruminococcus sp.]|nr:RluA family pseudouridine synthase [Ruminococcus sp.]